MRDNQGSNTMRDATFSRRDMLRGGALTVGAAFAEPLKAAAAEPSGVGPEQTSWVDSAMPEVTHRMIETNGIRLHVAEQGEGPLVILCHGFPECWYSWRHQLRALAKAGFRAMALDLRGYGRSDRPEEVAIAKQSTLVPKLRPAMMLAGCGHWTQQERAPEVSAAIIDFVRQL
jgi:pimeloyl-ACP methyl ester carboxylesterase